MAEVFSWNSVFPYGDSGSISISTSSTTVNITANNSSFDIYAPNIAIKTYANSHNYPAYGTITLLNLNNPNYYTDFSADFFPDRNVYANLSWDNYTGRYTADYFNSSNYNIRTINIPYGFTGKQSDKKQLTISPTELWEGEIGPSYQITVFTVAVTLDAPPVFSETPTISKNTPNGYYKGATTVTVNTNGYAQYGGVIESTTLTIGNQTVTVSGTNPIQLKLNSVGTFTPIITLTDSRGQTKSISLQSIVVQEPQETMFTYTQPVSSKEKFWTQKATLTVNINDIYVPLGGSAVAKLELGNQFVTRTDDGPLVITPENDGVFTPMLSVADSFGRTYDIALNEVKINKYFVPGISCQIYRAKTVTESGITKKGIKDDVSTECALVEVNITYTDEISYLLKPEIVINDTIITDVIWYSNYSNLNGASNEINWNQYDPGSPCTIYAIVQGPFPQEDSFEVDITAYDSEGGVSTTIVQTLPPAFFTIDFLAGGYGIAFGQPSYSEGFYCGMDAHFRDKAGTMRALFDFFYPVGSYYETSNADFNPNYTWGGTWILEIPGMVHVSGEHLTESSEYPVSKANNALGAGEKDGGETHHILTPSETASKNHTHVITHNHGFTVPSVTGGSCEISNSGGHKHTVWVWYDSIYQSGANRAGPVAEEYAEQAAMSIAQIGEGTGTHAHTVPNHTHTVSGGGVNEYVGSSGGIEEANGAPHYNMQPYINVYRWHRYE